MTREALEVVTPVDREPGKAPRSRLGRALTFPIRLRCASPKDLLTSTELEDAVARALGRAFARARRVLAAADVTGGGVVLERPELVKGDLAPHDQATLLSRLGRAIERAARTQVLPITVVPRPAQIPRHPARPAAAVPPAEAVAEPFDPARFDVAAGIYQIPSYQSGGQPVAIPVQTTTAEQQAAEDLALLNKEDLDRLSQLLQSTKADGSLLSEEALVVLRQFGEKRPDKLLKMLRAVIQEAATKIIGLNRTDDRVLLIVLEGPDPPAIFAAEGAVVAAQELPAARPLLREWESQAPGLQRLIGRFDALMDIRRKLAAYVSESKEKSPANFRENFSRATGNLARFAGALLATARSARIKGAQEFFASLDTDLLEIYRWVGATLDKVREIDLLLALYRLLYGAAADNLEEVTALLESRDHYLLAVLDHLLPTAALVARLLKDANDFYADWQGRAADGILDKVKKGFAELKNLGGLPESNYYGEERRESWAWPWKSANDYSYNRRAREVRAALAQLEKDVAGGSGQGRGTGYLALVNQLSQRLSLLIVRTQLLSFWYNCLEIQHQVEHHSIGSVGQRQGEWQGLLIPTRYGFPYDTRHYVPGWYERLDAVITEITKHYEQPDDASLKGKLEDWKQKLDAIQDDVKSAARREFYITVGITIFAIIVTAGVGSAVAGAGGGAVLVTLAEAGTFTLATNIGQSIVLDKPFDPSATFNEFLQNVALFGAFRVFNLGLLAGARSLAAGKTLTQLVIIFGGNLVASTGVPLLLTYLETGKLPEEMTAFLVVNLLMNALMALVAGPQLRDTLVKLDAIDAAVRADVVRQAQQIFAEVNSLTGEIRKVVTAGEMTEQQFQAFQKRASPLLSDFEKLMRRMDGTEFSDSALAALGLTRAQVKDWADQAVLAGKLIGDAKYVPPLPRTRALPAPAKVTGAVPTGEGTYEYNPSAAGQHPSQLALRLRGAGYEVTDTGGGVLRLTGPKGGEPRYLLLPATTPGAPVFPRTLLERAAGWRPAPERIALEADLERINSNLIKTLEGEFPDTTALASLALIVEYRGKLTTRWPVDSIRGLASMLQLERGITRAAVVRLFRGLDEAQLRDLFGKFQAIVNNPDVRPGSNFLVSDELTPARSAQLIEVYDAIRKSGLELPEDMSRKALSGLFKLVQDYPNDFLGEMKKIKKPSRRAWLESLSPIRGPAPVSWAEALLARHAQDIRPGINLLHGTAEDVAKAIEAAVQAKGGRFTSAEIRSRFVEVIDSYQRLLRRVQNGELALVPNITGAREEIETILLALERGSELLVLGPMTKKTVVLINPGLFELRPGIKVVNAPPEVKLQWDVAERTVDGRLAGTEVKAGKVALPDALSFLDPQSTVAPHDVDWASISDDENGRAVKQVIKIYQAARFATEFAKSWGNANAQVPDKVIRVGEITGEFKRWAASLGFRVEVTKPGGGK